ncbi:MAG: DNA-binding protein [Deltaproteobacteria bacterium]|nr:DNA-binding protein [Deltaproteobacteria bacterium]
MNGALVAVSLAASMLLSSLAITQGEPRPRGGGGWGPDGQHHRLYDPKTVETVTGVITKVERITPMRGMSAGIHLRLKTEKEAVAIHLGPEWYLSKDDLKLEPKDKIQVKGSRVTLNGKPAIIAAEVVKGDRALKLRDEDGLPVWSGWRRRSGP